MSNYVHSILYPSTLSRNLFEGTEHLPNVRFSLEGRIVTFDLQWVKPMHGGHSQNHAQ